jgi:hypothetical protein
MGCKGLVKGVLRDFYVGKRTPIHPSAWKVNPQKFLRSWNLEPTVLARIAYFHVSD